MAAYSLASAALLLASSSALNNGLARVPQQGYNSWYDVGMSPSEALVRETVQAMIDTGLVAAGYTYLNLDDGIVNVDRDANGDLVPDSKGFPNGWKPVADFIHASGMKFGIYTDRGTNTCGGRAGALGHEMQDAAFYAANGVDYVKEDSCNGSQDHQTAFSEYAAMRDALNATGRSIFFSLCGWEAWYAPVCHALGNSCRIGPDDSNWAGVLVDIDAMASLGQYAGPGAFNDPCLLLGRNMNGGVDVTDQQGRAQFSMWNTLAAPRLISSNVRNLSAFQLETYLNAEVLAVGSDVLARQGSRLVGGPLSGGGDGNVPATAQACAAGDATQAWDLNAPASGYIQNVGAGLCLNTDDCGADIILFDCLTSGGSCCGPTCLDVLKFTLNVDGTLTTPSQPGMCVATQGSGSQVALQPCAVGAPTQTWTHSAASKTLVAGTGLCLAAGAGGGNVTRANVWGKPLADGSWAITFINADPAAPATLVCDAACLAIAGWDAAQALAVRDLWAHADLPPTTAGVGLNVTALAPAGGVAMFRLTPTF